MNAKISIGPRLSEVAGSDLAEDLSQGIDGKEKSAGRRAVNEEFNVGRQIRFPKDGAKGYQGNRCCREVEERLSWKAMSILRLPLDLEAGSLPLSTGSTMPISTTIATAKAPRVGT